MSIQESEDKIANLEEVQRKANALEFESNKKIVSAEDEKKEVQGQKVEASHQEAGEAELSKREMGASSPKASGNTEAGVYGDIAAQGSGIASLEIFRTGVSVLSDNDPAAGQGVKTMDQEIKMAAGKDPGLHLTDMNVKPSNSIKTPFISDIPSENLPPRITGSGGSLASAVTSVTVERVEEGGGLELASVKNWSLAQQQIELENGVIQAKEVGAIPAGPGGMGQQPMRMASRAPSHEHDSIAAPKAPTFNDKTDTDTDTDTGWGSSST